MKRALILAIVVLTLALVLVSCAKEAKTTTKAPATTTAPSQATTTPGTATTTVPGTGTTTAPGVVTTAPDTVTTTVPVTTAGATPNTCDPTLEYHPEELKIKTNNYNHDSDYLIMDTSGNNGGERYADGNGFMVYEFDLTGMIEPTITLNIRQDYKVSISYDDYEYTEIANFQTYVAEHPEEFPAEAFNENGSYTAGSNITNLVIDPYEYGFYDRIYVMIEDATPVDGWGGTLMHFVITQMVLGAASEDDGVPDPEDASANWKDANKNYVKNDVTYSTGNSDEDIEFIYVDNAATTDTRRYCDGANFVIYFFNLRGMVEPTITLNVGQNYIIEICEDPTDPDAEWIEVENWLNIKDTYQWPEGHTPEYNEGGQLLNGGNFHELTIDPYEYEFYGNLFVRLSNCNPAYGWGGTVEGLTVSEWVED